MDLINALIASLSQAEGSPSFGDMAMKRINQTAGGKALTEFNQPDSTMASIYAAAKPTQPSAELNSFTEAPMLQQGVMGAQQPSYGGSQYLGGIPSLLKQYGPGSQGLLPYFGNQ
jgi:hypothetical protein